MVRFNIPLCPWCGQPMEAVRNCPDTHGTVVSCEHCGKPVEISGEMVITIHAKRAPLPLRLVERAAQE